MQENIPTAEILTLTLLEDHPAAEDYLVSIPFTIREATIQFNLVSGKEL